MDTQKIIAAVRQRAFRPSKPHREIRPIDLQRNCPVLASRKYNGNYATALCLPGGTVEFYTASGLKLTSLQDRPRFEAGSWKDALTAIPPYSILLGEIFIPSDRLENLGEFQHWYTWHKNGLNGKTAEPKAAKFLAFDLLALDGRSLSQNPYHARFADLPESLRVESAPYQNLHEANQAIQSSQERGIEGYVFWDANASTRCKIGGKSKTYGGAWKVKPIFHERFTLLAIVQANPNDMILNLGNPNTNFNCGSGLTPDERRDILTRFQTGKAVSVKVAHNGYDEEGRPELPRMIEFSAN